MAQHTFTLNNGVKIPGLGFGTFANEGAEGETYAAVTKALEVGYRHLDCAAFYKNEGEVGDAIRDFIKQNPTKLKREDLFVCTKVWNHMHKPEDVKYSLQESLRKLGLDYVDLFLVHWPIAAERTDDYQPRLGADGKYITIKELTENPEPTWRAMEDLYAAKKARAIGVSNWTIPGLEALFAYAKVQPAVNQIEIHPFLPNTALVQFCQAHGVLPAAYSPLGSQNQIPATGETVRADPTLNAVADRSGHSLAQVLLAWGLRRGYAVLPKSSTPSRIESNFRVPVLSDADFAAVNAVADGRHTRFVNMQDEFGYNLWPEESVENGTAAA